MRTHHVSSTCCGLVGLCGWCRVHTGVLHVCGWCHLCGWCCVHTSIHRLCGWCRVHTGVLHLCGWSHVHTGVHHLCENLFSAFRSTSRSGVSVLPANLRSSFSLFPWCLALCLTCVRPLHMLLSTEQSLDAEQREDSLSCPTSPCLRRQWFQQ